MMFQSEPRVAFFAGSFGGGGIERITAHLAHSFVKMGIKVDLLLNHPDSNHLHRMPPETRIIDLKAATLYRSLPKLMNYLKQEHPSALLSADHYMNEIALLAKRFTGVSTRVVVSERNQLSQTVRNSKQLKGKLTPLFARLLYPWADGIVAVSQGVAKDLAVNASISPERIQTIYNPAMTSTILDDATKPLNHPWFAAGELPVILGVGKLEAQKDFPTLIRAFAKVRQAHPSRLVILGWGPDRPQLEALIQELELGADVDLPGYSENPSAYMAKSAVFVLSSAWEGFGNVLVEAMALGTPVVSTNCESGPAEILRGGEYGHLTRVGDSDAMASAILKVLSGDVKPVDSDWMGQFGLENATQQYLKVLGLTDACKMSG